MREADLYVYWAWVEAVVDADTFDLVLDLGFKVYIRERVRLYGVDAPEIYGVKHGSEEHQRGLEAVDFVQQWLGTYANGSQPPLTGGNGYGWVRIRSHDGDKLQTGKYGRWIAEVHASGHDLGTDLVEADHGEAVSY